MPKKHNLSVPIDRQILSGQLLTWYDGARRDLPWRAKPGVEADPYHVWLSEIMLQQTTVKAVIPYFERFIKRWPSIQALGTAPRDEVLAAWAGLGYYSRARNLHACAQIVSVHGFPDDEAGLRKLPGIGAYTAGAIAAIAFDRPAAAIDGNVERVISRLFAIEEPLPSAKPHIRNLAAGLVPKDRPGDYAQAMMDLGATICTPRSPSCLVCPVNGLCKACREGSPERFPVKARKAARPMRRGEAFVLLALADGEKSIYLRRRPDKGLLGGMMEVPSSGWDGNSEARRAYAPGGSKWISGNPVHHTFTHFHLVLEISAAAIPSTSAAGIGPGGFWVPLTELAGHALPSVMKKAVAAGLEALASTHADGSAAKSASSVAAVETSARPSTRAGRK
jgi:A/G-specific adenine glycosylase